MTHVLTPVAIDTTEARQWTKHRPLAFTAAIIWAEASPRAKGWMPRLIGRTMGRSMKTTLRTASGGTIAVDPRNLDIYTSVVRNGGVWEKRIHDVCKAVARPGDTVFDIGANAGMVAIDLAAHLKGDLTLIAFEPIPSLSRGIALSAYLSGFESNIRVYEAMLGEKPGRMTLYMPSHAIHASAVAREHESVELEREVFTLDELVESAAIPSPDLIKIDIEGGELGVFKGATRTLAASRPLIIFEADQNMARFGYGRRELVSLLASCAPYAFYYIFEHGVTPATDLDAPFTDDTTNMIALPPGRPELTTPISLPPCPSRRP